MIENVTSNFVSGVIWVVGLSGSGKSTLINALSRKLKRDHQNVLSLDGDAIRKCINNTKNFSKENRLEQLIKVQMLAQEFERQGMIVLVATLYCTQLNLDNNRRILDNYFEIYADAPLEKLIEEDNKSIYGKFLEGNMVDVVGVDIDWVPPEHPDMVFSKFESDADNIADEVISKITFL